MIKCPSFAQGTPPTLTLDAVLGQWSFLVSCSRLVIQAQVKKYSLDFFFWWYFKYYYHHVKDKLYSKTCSYISNHIKDVNLDEIVDCACNSKCLNF